MRRNPFLQYLTPENHLQKQVNDYIRYQYPKVLFWHTLNEGKKSPFERFLAKYLGMKPGVPDNFIATARHGFKGLFLELKVNDIHLKDGITLKSDPHLRVQYDFIQSLRKEGYKAEFAIGFDQAKSIIDQYLS
jgi:hypothetical protein